MRIGLTYDLKADWQRLGYDEEAIAEFDRPETVQALAQALSALGHEPEPIGNLHALVAKLAAGERWPLVFNIAEGMHGFGREAQVPALLDGYGIPYVFSDPLTLSLTLHKGQAKRVVRDAGVPTPDFALVEQPQDVAQIHLPFPLFAKPVAEGTGKGVTHASRVETPQQLQIVCQDLLARFRQPVLVEIFLPGREFTVGVVGTGPKARVLGGMEVLLPQHDPAPVYSYDNKAHYEGRVEYKLMAQVLSHESAQEIEQVVLDAWRVLGCRDGGRVDIRLDGQGRPHFLEVNPLAGLHPQDSDLVILCRLLNLSYTQLIGYILTSALERM